jgi:hypothetical protein
MIARIGRMSVGAMLVVASTCLAADEPGYQPGKGAVGGQLGGSYFRFDRAIGADWFGDYSAGAQMRFAFSGHFRYVVNPWLRWQIGPGFTWAGYNDHAQPPFTDLNFPDETEKDAYLTLLLPVSAQAQYVIKRGSWLYYAGAGPGFYRVWVQNHRKVLKDPVSLKLHRKIHPGASGQIGVERFFKGLPSTSLDVALAGHLVFAEDDDEYVSGWNSNLMALEAKVGLTYYFGFGERKKPESETALPHERGH